MERMPIPPIGTRFGHVEIIGQEFIMRGYVRYITIRCDCGTIKDMGLSKLRCGFSKSCGCQTAIRHKEVMTTHNISRTTEYHIWHNMVARCHNPAAPAYADYGGRGIHVCEAWRHSVIQFIADMGMRPSRNYTLDRRDNNGDYTPSNCCWSTHKQQSRNTRHNRFITYEGHTASIAEWVERTGINRSTIRERLQRGWTIKNTLTIPAHRI